jgi:uncharacterized protein YkwD
MIDKLILVLLAVGIGFFLFYNYGVDEGYLPEPSEENSFLHELREEDFKSFLVEDHIFNLTNDLRIQKGLKPYERSKELDLLARKHSVDMQVNGYFDHINLKGEDPTERAENSKIKAWVDRGEYLTGIGENIGIVPWHSDVIGCGNTMKNKLISECHVNSWIESQGHYENLIDSEYSELGVGVAYDSFSGDVYATQNFR